MRNIFICFLIAFLPTLLFAKEIKMKSPDGKYILTINDGEELTYSLNYQDCEIVTTSALGIKWNEDWKNDITIENIKESQYNETWKPVYGERSTIQNHYKSSIIELTKKDSRNKMILEVRMFNEGVAFRYCFTGGQYLKITDEYTEFVMPENSKAWHTERAQTVYNLLPLKEWKNESDRPLLIELPNKKYACLTEAKVIDYVRTKFKLSDSKKNCIQTSMYGPVEDIAPYQTPWRVIMCGNTTGEILNNNDIILNLNDECKIADTSWIKPGKVMREVTLTTEGAKATIDFAVKHNMQYILFDAGWYGFEYDKNSDATTVTLDPRRNPKIDALNMKYVIDYAKSKGIGVILYVNQRALQQQLDDILPLYKSWGISGIKFGFVQVGSQVWTKWMHEAVKKCAQYGLMVDIHDEYRPTGFSRTYPNLMNQEGIRGNEEFPDATHNATLPFTRYVAGAADYTICYYRQDFGRLQSDANAYGVPRSRTIKTTPAHQLALSVIYYGPLQLLYWYDRPSDSQNEPELKFFDDVYTTWDDSKVLQGEVGKYISMLRRRGNEWFIGSITNNDSRKISINLDFLPAGEDFIAEIYSDGDKSINTRTKVKVLKFRVNSKMKINFQLKKSGGSAMRIIPNIEGKKVAKLYKGETL